MDADERALFAASLEQASARHTGEALDAALDELGWHEALRAEPDAAVPLLFEAQGAANSTSSALMAVLAAALAPEIASACGVVLPALGQARPPGEAAGGHVTVAGLGTAGLARCAEALVVVPARDGHRAAVVATGDLDLQPVRGLDPDLGLLRVSGAAVAATPWAGGEPVAWDAAVATGQRALAHELVGASRAMLAAAREHAVERVQFGRPIGAFQAVRHRLAESLVAIEAAEAAAVAATDDGSPLTAALAKAVAGRSARTVARHCQQVLAGIGFTTEHPHHRHLRRVMVLDRLLGDSRSLTRSLGRDAIAGRSLPELLPL